MKYRQLNNMTISAVGMGCMGLSHAYGSPIEKNEAIRLLQKAERLYENARAVDIKLTQQEVNALDTALDNMPMSAVFGGSKTKSTDKD